MVVSNASKVSLWLKNWGSRQKLNITSAKRGIECKGIFYKSQVVAKKYKQQNRARLPTGPQPRLATQYASIPTSKLLLA